MATMTQAIGMSIPHHAAAFVSDRSDIVILSRPSYAGGSMLSRSMCSIDSSDEKMIVQ
jgi:ABC-type iron transport system FetAB ATPase subunit